VGYTPGTQKGREFHEVIPGELVYKPGDYPKIFNLTKTWRNFKTLGRIF